MSAETIYKQLITAGFSPAGACGMLGNMKAESALRANNAQDGMTRLSDEDYTAKFDRDPESCYRDAVGYGLCQWTYWSRKEGLYNHCKLLGRSVGDEEAQVSFCIQEIKSGYPSLFWFLCSTESVYDAARRICTEYERPAVNNIAERAKYGNQFYTRMNGEAVVETPTAAPEQEVEQVSIQLKTLTKGMRDDQVKAAQMLLNGWGFNCGEPDGIFGGNTEKAVIRLQKARKLTVDRIIGPKTWKALHEE